MIRWSSRATSRRLSKRVLRRLGRKLFLTTVTVKDGFAYSVYGVWLLQRRDDNTYNFCCMGDYGFFLSDYIARQNEPFVFLDIGANAGLYSVLAAQNPYVLAVHAFEPDPATLPYLRANLATAAYANWTVHPVALSDSDGHASLSTSERHSGIATLRTNHLDLEAFDSVVTVELKNHQYLDESVDVFPSVCPVVVKIDVEGHELNVLRALAAWQGWPSVSAIYLELDSTFSDTYATRAFLETQGLVEHHREGTAAHCDALYTRPVGKG